MLHKAIFDSAQIHKLLTLLGADLHYIGFRYTEYALLLMEEDEQCIHSVTKCLYPEIARRYQTSCHAVERNIRTLSQVAWKSEPGLLQKMAGHTLEKRPTSSQFLAILFACLTNMDSASHESPFILKISDLCKKYPEPGVKNGSGYSYVMEPALYKTRHISIPGHSTENILIRL